jgi:hypothetical protein
MEKQGVPFHSALTNIALSQLHVINSMRGTESIMHQRKIIVIIIIIIKNSLCKEEDSAKRKESERKGRIFSKVPKPFRFPSEIPPGAPRGSSADSSYKSFSRVVKQLIS